MKIRDKRTRGWLWVQNQIIDQWMPKMGPAGLAMYMVLARYADQHDQSSYPSHATIAAKMGVSRRTVIRTMKLLEELGLVEVERRHKENGAQTSNVYYLIDPPCDSESHPPVPESHTPCDTSVTLQVSPHIKIEQDHHQQEGGGGETPSKHEDPLGIWQSARGATGTPSQSDQDCAQRLVAEHGQAQAVRLVRALAGIVKRRYPDCRRLSYAWQQWGGEAIAAVKSELLAEQQRRDSNRRIGTGRADNKQQWWWDALPERLRAHIVARHPEQGGVARAKAGWIERMVQFDAHCRSVREALWAS